MTAGELFKMLVASISLAAQVMGGYFLFGGEIDMAQWLQAICIIWFLVAAFMVVLDLAFQLAYRRKPDTFLSHKLPLSQEWAVDIFHVPLILTRLIFSIPIYVYRDRHNVE